jgi:hypothetical protein
MLLDEVNQWMVALRWGTTAAWPALSTCDGDERSTSVEQQRTENRMGRGLGRAGSHQEGHGGFREAGVASEWPERRRHGEELAVMS